MSEDSRRVAARIVAGFAATFWALPWFGLIDLLVVVEQDEQFHEHYLFESGWGLLFLVLVAVPLMRLVARPGEPVALAQLGVVAVAVLVGAAWRATWPQAWNGLGVVVTVGVVAWLGRVRPVHLGRPDPALAALAILGIPAALAYAAPLIENTTQEEDITNGVSHYPMQASLALAVVMLVALAAVTRARLPAWTAAFSTCWLGVESIVYPHLRGSFGSRGGVLTVVWAVMVMVSAEVTHRRTRGVDSEAHRSA